MALDYFSLDANAMAVMVSLQSAMIEQDIRSTRAGDFFGDSLRPKRTWYLEWLGLLKEGFANLPEAVRPALYPIESGSFHSALERLSQCSNPFARELILLELAAFEPYWPLTAGEKGWAQKVRDLTKSTPSLSSELLARSLENASRRLGLPENKGSLLRSELHSVNRSLSGYWKNIAIIAGVGTVAGALTFGIAAPIIGGLIGHSMGLAGAAAVKAGLAAMGGGAIACGGMGVAGGTAVIFGGGALLGIGVGDSVAATINPVSALIQAVKIEVFLRCVVAGHENAKQVVKDVLCQLRTSITRMDDELKSVRLNPNTEKECIAEREEIVKILGACSKRCAAWAKEEASCLQQTMKPSICRESFNEKPNRPHYRGITGIGRATAIAFAREGAKIVVSGRREDKGRELVAELHGLGSEAEFIKADVRHEEDVKNLIEKTVKLFGRLDVAVNNAGTEGKVGPIIEQTVETYSQVFDTNVLGVLLCLNMRCVQCGSKRREALST